MPPRDFSRIVRRTHMYLALFLTPWMLMYALSSLAFNHFAAIRDWYGGTLNQFEKVEEMDYPNAFGPDTLPEDAAKQILLDLNMDGAHFVQGKLDGPRFTINRQAAFAVKRVVYFPKENRVLVERQVPNFASFLTRLHTRHGYEQKYTSMQLWGLGVELAVLAMLFWVASGIWLWWEIKPARKWGAAFALGGFGLFAVMLFAI